MIQITYGILLETIQLELLSDYEVEVRTAVALAAECLVKSVTPVDAEHTDHRQEDSCTETH